MRITLSMFMLISALLTTAALAQPPDTERAIRDVIQAQLGAFQEDDADLAFSFASAEIQSRFGTPEAFMAMVRAGYDAVYRPSAVEFQELHADGEDQWVQQVLLVDRNGRPILAFYPMRAQADGSWRIGGCTLIPANGQLL